MTLEHEPGGLREGGDDAGDQQDAPAFPEGDHRRRREDDGGEGGADLGEVAVLDDGHQRHQESPDEPERRDELRLPTESDHRRDARDAGSRHERPGLRTNPYIAVAASRVA